LELAETSGVPVVVLAGDSDTSPGSAISTRNPWNVSNGAEFASLSGTVPISFSPGLEALATAGYSTVTPSIRAKCPPSSLVTLTLGTSQSSNTTSEIANVSTFPYWNLSIVSAVINNQGKYLYNGTVTLTHQNGIQLLNWSFAAHNSTFQALNFKIHSLAGISGLQFNATTLPSGPLPFLMQILLNGTYADVKSYVSNIDLGTGQTTYSLYFPMATGPGAKDLLSNPGNITRFVIGLTSTGAFDTLELSNFSSFRSSVMQGFDEITLSALPTGTDQVLALQSPPECLVDTIALVASSSVEPIRASAVQVDYDPQLTSTDLSISPSSDGWGILQVAETYSPSWGLQGDLSSSLHFPVNFGLNGWLVELKKGSTVTATIRFGGYVLAGTVIEGLSLPLLGFAGWVAFYHRGRSQFWRRIRSRDVMQPDSKTLGPHR
jgi:hypothetical protein